MDQSSCCRMLATIFLLFLSLFVNGPTFAQSMRLGQQLHYSLLPNDTVLAISLPDVPQLKKFLESTDFAKAAAQADPSAQRALHGIRQMAHFIGRTKQNTFGLDEILGSFQGQATFALFPNRNGLSFLCLIDAKDNEIVWEVLSDTYARRILTAEGQFQTQRIGNLALNQVATENLQEFGWFIAGNTVVVGSDLARLSQVASRIQGIGTATTDSPPLTQDENWKLANQGMRVETDVYADLYVRPDLLVDRLSHAVVYEFLKDSRTLEPFSKRHLKAIRMQLIVPASTEDLHVTAKFVCKNLGNKFSGTNKKEAVLQADRLSNLVPANAHSATSIHTHIGDVLEFGGELAYGRDSAEYESLPEYMKPLPKAYRTRTNSFEDYFGVFQDTHQGVKGWLPIKDMKRIVMQLDEVLLFRKGNLPENFELMRFIKKNNLILPPDNEAKTGENGRYYALHHFSIIKGGLGIVGENAYFSSFETDLNKQILEPHESLSTNEKFIRVQKHIHGLTAEGDRFVSVHYRDLESFFALIANTQKPAQPFPYARFMDVKDWTLFYRCFAEASGPMGCLVRRTNDGFYVNIFTLKRGS